VLVVSGFISGKEKALRIQLLKISVIDSVKYQFIKSNDILHIFISNNISIKGKSIDEIDLGKIESILKSRQIIDHAEAFITEPGVLKIEISQKTPFVRVFNRDGKGYYLDKKGNIIPLAGDFSPFIIVANGFISEPFNIGRTININDVKYDSIGRSKHTIYDVFHLAEFITNDEFWNSQIEQIYVNNKYEFELIPRVGSHIIELGYVENLEEKFNNLKILYLKGFNKLGWNKYDKISLKYKNQVVCTKIQ
jgi:cell division protein FtsQ